MTNLQLIADALRLINVINETETPSAEQGAKCLRSLNQLMEEWSEDSVNLQYFEQTSTSATFPCPAYSHSGVTAALAMRVAPTFGAEVPPLVLAMRAEGESVIRRKSILHSIKQADARNIPLGEAVSARSNILTGS